MNIALLRATGFVASALLDEALSRGHTVTASVRDAERLAPRDRLMVKQGQTKLSVQDYTVAMIDELERPRHIRQLFTVGY